MKKPELTRKQFINLSLGLVGSTLIAESCAPVGDAPPDGSAATGGSGTGGAGTGGSGTGGAGTGGSGTGGSGTGGRGTGGSGTGGSGTGGRGTGGAASGGSGTGGRGTGGAGTGGRGTGGRGTGGAAAGGRGGGGGAGCTGAIQAAISGNHGHALMIPMADIVAGVTKCYNAMGTATHPHYVTVTAADFATLSGGGVVRVFSCNGGDHQYVLSCGTPPAAMAPTCPDEIPGSVACT